VTGDYLLRDEASYWALFDGGQRSEVHRTYLDQEIDGLSTPGLHHVFVQMPDESVVWGSLMDSRDGEPLMQKSFDDKKEREIWNCLSDWEGVNRCESNGLFYSPERDSFLISYYSNESVVEVDNKTGELLWWAGADRLATGGYTFDPAASQYAWQHGVTYTDADTLLVSSEALSSGGGGGGRYTTVVYEYAIDHEADTLTEIWSYDAEVYADTFGDAWRLENGNTLHVVGSAGHVKEVTADGVVVWHMNYDGYLMGRGELLDDLYALVAPTP
jgi:hypothetical protein